MSPAHTIASRPVPSHGRLVRSMLFVIALVALGAPTLSAQTIDDGVMVADNHLVVGAFYAHDSWEKYWEGALERTNGNLGTLTTQSVTWLADYGFSERLNLIATLPYVWTEASQGVLHGLSGLQDVTFAAKYRLLETPLTSQGTLRAIAVGSVALPASDYTPDFLPLSIGSASRRYAGRLTLDFRARQGWFIHGTASYTWRDKVTLDRPSYYTDGQLFLSNEVALPDVFDFMVSAGYTSANWHVPVSFLQQSTQGGGDIRRQDQPFVSNRMNFAKVEAMVMYRLPQARSLALRVTGTYTVDGRNVGKSATLTTGLLYDFRF